jgi:hypothetical protein
MKDEFKKVWSLYKEGIIREEPQVKVSRLETLVSEEAMAFSQALDDLVTLDTSLLHPSEGLDFQSLEQIFYRVQEAEQKAISFLALGVFDPYAYSHIVRVIMFGENYNQCLLDSFDKSYKAQDYPASKQILGLLSRREILEYVPKEKVSAVERYEPPKKPRQVPKEKPKQRQSPVPEIKPIIEQEIEQKQNPASEPKQPAYLCLTTYLRTTEPESFPILKLANLLRTRKPWIERFYAFGQRLRILQPTLRQRDITYLSGLYSAIQQSLEEGELRQSFDTDRRNGLAIGYLFALDEYIARSKPFVPSETTNFK